jgi:hypothetical protein
MRPAKDCGLIDDAVCERNALNRKHCVKFLCLSITVADCRYPAMPAGSEIRTIQVLLDRRAGD